MDLKLIREELYLIWYYSYNMQFIKDKESRKNQDERFKQVATSRFHKRKENQIFVSVGEIKAIKIGENRTKPVEDYRSEIDINRLLDIVMRKLSLNSETAQEKIMSHEQGMIGSTGYFDDYEDYKY